MGGDIFDLLPWAIGFSLPCLIPMAIAAWFVLRRSGIGRKIYPVPAPMPGGLPALPKPLQVVVLPNVRFAVYVLSGLVLNVRGEIHRRTVHDDHAHCRRDECAWTYHDHAGHRHQPHDQHA